MDNLRQTLITKRDRLQQGIMKLSQNLEQFRGALSVVEELLQDLEKMEKSRCTEVQGQQTDGVDQSA